jgi:hypothetical protein
MIETIHSDKVPKAFCPQLQLVIEHSKDCSVLVTQRHGPTRSHSEHGRKTW